MLSKGIMSVAILTALLSLSATSWAGTKDETIVIANSSVEATEVEASNIKKLFLGKSTKMSDGTKVNFVVLSEGPVHEAFLKQRVGKTPSQFLRHWRKLVFSGKGTLPQEFASEDALVAYVAATEGAIGYVGPDADTRLVNVLEVK